MGNDKPLDHHVSTKPHVFGRVTKGYLFGSDDFSALREKFHVYQTYPATFCRRKPHLSRMISGQSHSGHGLSAGRIRRIHNRKCPLEEAESMGVG